MKIEEYIQEKRAKLENIERALYGSSHPIPVESVTIIDMLQFMLGAIDTEQNYLTQIAEGQDSTRLAKALIARADQLQRTRDHMVRALNELANTEIEI